jgi:hypothetical protein
MSQRRLLYSATVVAVLVVLFLPLVAIGVTPQIIHPNDRDINMNGIDEQLEARIAELAASGQPGLPVRLIVTLYSAPSREQINLFKQMGGNLAFTYRHAVYGFAGTLAADRVSSLASVLGPELCIIQEDAQGGGTLDDAARQCRVRAIVWDPTNGYGLDGDADITIAIFDTGIDVTHTDLSGGRLVFWHDFTTEHEATSTDRNGHGSHVTGIATGTGAALGSGAITSLTTTMSDRLPATNGNGYVDMIKVPVLGSGQVTSNLAWQGAGTAQINLATSGASWLGGYTSATSPLIHTWSISSTDIYKARAGNQAGLGGAAYSMLTTYPYAAVGDGFNLFRGMAPGCKVACPKLLYQDCSGNAAEWTAAFDSIAAVNSLFNIKVANASIGLFSGGTSVALRTAVNSMVSAGTVVTISAGNDYPTYKIPDPGLAEKAVTVGAINDFGAMTQYSSNGPTSSVKPDVVAPRGSLSWNTNVGSEITSVDTNVNDAYKTGFADRQTNDYCNIFGTSMSSPCVAGLAALMIDAREHVKGSAWGYSEAEALHIKMLIQITATETNMVGEESSGNNPTLGRGTKDRVEGYGKINGDAAIEGVIHWFMTPPDTFFNVTFGAGAFDRKCWASEVVLCGPDTADVSMRVPDTGDFDLYLYDAYGSSGEPVIITKSTSAGLGVDEEIKVAIGYTCNPYYLVAKRVSGSGTATIYVARTASSGIASGDHLLETPILGPSYPNPFNTNTAIPYGVPGRGSQHVSLKIYDVRGTLVRTLLDGEAPAGSHRVFWDGKDGGASLVAPGVYFARLVVCNVEHVSQLTVVR